MVASRRARGRHRPEPQRRRKDMSFIPEDAAHWFEIPVTDMARAKAFYGAVLQNELKDEEGGPNPIAIFAYKGNGRVSGHLYPGRPAPAGSGPTVHLAVAA